MVKDLVVFAGRTLKYGFIAGVAAVAILIVSRIASAL